MTTAMKTQAGNNGQIPADPANYDPFADASMQEDPNLQDDPQSNQGPAAQANAPKPRYRISSGVDYLGHQPKVEFALEPTIEFGTVTVVFGESGDGKTLAMSAFGVCAALGIEFVGFKTTQCNVLFIDEESGERHLRRRLGEVFRGYHADDQTPFFSISYACFDFAKDEDCNELENLIRVSGARLIIIDALSDVAPGRNENSTDEMKPVLKNLRHIAEKTGAAIIVIHHANKQGGYRGTSSIKADVDLMIKVEKDKDEITFTSNKVRYGAPTKFSAIANWFNLDPKEFWLTASTNTPKSKHKFKVGEIYVLKYLLKNGNSKVDDIESNADICKAETARRAVYALAGMTPPLAERTNAGSRGVPAEYQLTPSGQTEAQNL